MVEQNWHQGEWQGRRYAYSEPSPGRYPWQWYWDSCFAAIVRGRYDRERARAELQSLLARSHSLYLRIARLDDQATARAENNAAVGGGGPRS